MGQHAIFNSNQTEDRNLLDRLEDLSHLIGNTPCVHLEIPNLDVYAKLEFLNLAGSMKDRPAYRILYKLITNGKINSNSTIVESSSGNFAIALAMFCKRIGINFVSVIDPNITKSNEALLRSLCSDVIKVSERDMTGGYLITRINEVKRLCKENRDWVWTNQYENVENFMAHYDGIGKELANNFHNLDYIFLGVSTGATLAGVSTRLKERFPHIKVIAVDIEGSVIFGGPPKKRYIPGIGASIIPPLLKRAIIDDILIVTELETVQGCRELYERHGIFAGGSSGSNYAAIKKYFNENEKPLKGNKPKIGFICADRGSSYLESIYNPGWVDTHLNPAK